MVGVTKQQGTLFPLAAANLAARTATHTAGKLHWGSTIRHLRYLICSEEYENNIEKMMGCSHQEFRVWW
jgi:hypothetical protein